MKTRHKKPLVTMPDAVKAAFGIFHSLLPENQKRCLLLGLISNDSTLCQGVMLYPTCMPHAECYSADLLSYPFMKVSGATVEEVIKERLVLAQKMDEGNGLAFATLLCWWQETSRDNARYMLQDEMHVINRLKLSARLREQRDRESIRELV